MLSVLPHVDYKPWYAMAEFVDNSIQSYAKERRALQAAEDGDYRLLVTINIDTNPPGRITVTDNAAGISDEDYPHAFRAAALPRDRSGLSEFGMGMKTAACWFARRWSVTSAALGEGIERHIEFDVEEIVRTESDYLDALCVHVPPRSHYTTLVMADLRRMPQGGTLRKMKSHLASIYRRFIQAGEVIIRFDGDELRYESPRILVAPYYRSPDAPPTTWRKDVRVDLDRGVTLTGFAALRETASTSEAGFALFRRGRLILGSHDEGYRPEALFRKSNSYTYQRLFGELNVEGVDVSHTKSGFRWEDYEDVILQALKVQIDAAPVPLLDQAEGFRSRPKPVDIQTSAQHAVDTTAKVIDSYAPPVLAQQLETPELPDIPTDLNEPNRSFRRDFPIVLNGVPWQIALEAVDDTDADPWLEVADRTEQTGAGRRLEIRVSLVHPFMLRFAGVDPERIEPLLRVAAGLALAETVARDSGVTGASLVRLSLNDLLARALARP